MTTSTKEDAAAQKYAAGEAEAVAVERLLDEWRARRGVARAFPIHRAAVEG